MSSQTVWLGVGCAAAGFAAKHYIDNCQRDAEASKERKRAERARERKEEVAEERRKEGEDEGKSELFHTETIMAISHEDKLSMDLLREIKQRFEVKRGEQARFPSIELPYLHTEGAAEDPAAAVVAVALALGKDFSRLADVPVHLEELFALESVSMDTVRELNRILVQSSLAHCSKWTPDRDILDMPVVVGRSRKSGFLHVLLDAARHTEIYFGDFALDTQISTPSNKRVSQMEALAQNLGLYLRRVSDFDVQKTDKFLDWVSKRRCGGADKNVRFFLANFHFGRGFRCPVTNKDGKYEPVLREIKVLAGGGRRAAAPTLLSRSDRDKFICFFGTYLFTERLKVLVERLKSNGFLTDTHMGGRVSIEHIAALSGELEVIEGQPLRVMRNATLHQIKHAPEDFDRRLRAYLTKCLADLTTWQPDLGSNRQREIDAFCGDYARLVEMRLHLVPHYKGRPPSHMVPLYPISAEAWESLLWEGASSQQRRCRHILQDDEKTRNRAARYSGSVPLGFDLLAFGSVGSVLFGLSWEAIIDKMLPCVAGLIHWLAPHLLLWLGLGNAATTYAGWSYVGWVCKLVGTAVFTFYLARCLVQTARAYSDVFGLDLDKHCSDTDVVMQMRIATYSWFARLLGLALPLQRTLAPLEARCVAHLHRWRADIARARFFAALKRGKISTREIFFIVDSLCTSADSLRSRVLPRRPGSTEAEAAEAEGNLVLSDGACWIPGTDQDAQRFFDLAINDTAQIEGDEGGRAPLAEPFLLMGPPLVGGAQRAGAATARSGPSIAPDRNAPLEGKPVRISGLVAKPELNGVIATADKFDESNSRYAVRLGDGTRVAIKTANLTEVSAAEALSAQRGVGDGGATGRGASGKSTTTRITDERTCLAALQENGYSLVRWQGKHWVWRRELPSGQQQGITTSKTPSDHRAYQNLRAQLARNNRDKDAEEEALAADARVPEARTDGKKRGGRAGQRRKRAVQG